MRLARIEARTFGALRDCSLDGLGEGLTIVYGPNESGKSTYAALVRQVLYGFPGKRDPEYRYRPAAGGREGRLVFADPAGEWAVGRREGTHGGPVQVETIRGADRPHLRDEIVGTITEQTYRVVFGFGLDELADIEHGTDQDVMARLFAGAFGLGVNPLDARKRIEEAAGACFKVRGAGTLNVALDRMRAEKERIHELEAQASAYAEEQARLKELERRIEPLKAERDRVDAALRATEADSVRAVGLVAALEDARDRLAAVDTDRELAVREAARIVFDARLLEIAADIEALLQEESGARQHEDRAKQIDLRAAQLRDNARALGVPEDVRGVEEARAQLEAWRGREARLESDIESAQRVAEANRAKAKGWDEVLEPSLANERRQPSLAGMAVLLIGLVAVGTGYFTSQWVAIAFGVLGAAAGLAMFLIRPKGSTGREALSEERLRFEADARAAEELAQDARSRLETERAAWAEYLAERSLSADGTSAAEVAALLERIRERDALLRQADGIEAEAAREREAAADWARRLTQTVRPRLGIADVAPEPHALAIRAREALDAARDAKNHKDEIVRTVEQLDAELERLRQARERAEKELAEISAAHSLQGDPVLALNGEIARLSEQLQSITAEYEEVVTQRAELVGRLGSEGRDDALARARQRLEGYRARADEAASAYLVESVALRLMDRARERFEQERQPEVVRTAGRAFSSMTDGRFASVRVPIGGESIAVVSASGNLMPTQQLSKGTVEQLYLALRVGLIESFGGQGPHLPVLMDDIVVNYDAERMKGAAGAIAELARSRQVVFFTCHEATAAMLGAAVDGAVQVELDRCVL